MKVHLFGTCNVMTLESIQMFITIKEKYVGITPSDILLLKNSLSVHMFSQCD